MNKVKRFYDQLQFPGFYYKDHIVESEQRIANRYLCLLDQKIDPGDTVLDAGCGTGFVSNLLAYRHPQCEFDAVDFADSVDYGQDFARLHDIKNITYYRGDLRDWQSTRQYDKIICQGVLHHIPEYERALRNICQMLRPGGQLLLGVYHPWGKWSQKKQNIEYGNRILELDQEHHPFEITFSLQQVRSMLPGWRMLDHQPRLLGSAALASLFNARSGGLVLYILEKSKNELVD